MVRYFLDSDVIIWFLSGREVTVNLVNRLAENTWLSCSVLNMSEILMGTRSTEQKVTEDLINSLKVYPVTKEIALLASLYLKKYSNRGVGFVDAHIAATCVLNHLVLVTYDKKHYPMPELEVYTATN